jgi:Acyltransferase family
MLQCVLNCCLEPSGTIYIGWHRRYGHTQRRSSIESGSSRILTRMKLFMKEPTNAMTFEEIDESARILFGEENDLSMWPAIDEGDRSYWRKLAAEGSMPSVSKTDFLPRIESLPGVAALNGLAFRTIAALSNGVGAVVTFFVLSGFVLARSLDGNSDPVRFFRNRVFRLFPAAMAVVALLTPLHWQFGLFVGYEASFDPLTVYPWNYFRLQNANFHSHALQCFQMFPSMEPCWGRTVHGRHNRLDRSVGGVRRRRDVSEQTDHETFQMKVVRWMAYILVMPIIWLVCGAICLWELITGKHVDFDGPSHRPSGGVMTRT